MLQKYVTINTHKDYFDFTVYHLVFIQPPAGFQQVMEELLQGIDGVVVVYLDDILIMGRSRKEHLQRLEEVLKQLQDAGLRVKRDKSRFMKKEIIYLRHLISAQGLQPTKDKVKAIQEAPTPTGTSELKAYLGILTYYDKFLPHRASVLAQSVLCLRKGHHEYGLLTSSLLLTHFNPTLPAIHVRDAPLKGIGAVLSHQLVNGDERPIAYASRLLSAADQNYSQLDKEALSVVWGVKKYHCYVYGRPFS